MFSFYIVRQILDLLNKPIQEAMNTEFIAIAQNQVRLTGNSSGFIYKNRRYATNAIAGKFIQLHDNLTERMDKYLEWQERIKEEDRLIYNYLSHVCTLTPSNEHMYCYLPIGMESILDQVGITKLPTSVIEYNPETANKINAINQEGKQLLLDRLLSHVIGV